MERRSKPNWWIAFALVPLMIVAFLIDSQFKYVTEVHEIVDGGIVIATFGLMFGWVHANAAALQEEEIAKEHWVFIEEPSDDEHVEIQVPADLIPEPTHEPAAPHAHADVSVRYIDPDKGRYN